MAGNKTKTWALVEILYPFQGNISKMDTCTKSGALKSWPYWGAHTCIGYVGE